MAELGYSRDAITKLVSTGAAEVLIFLLAMTHEQWAAQYCVDCVSFIRGANLPLLRIVLAFALLSALLVEQLGFYLRRLLQKGEGQRRGERLALRLGLPFVDADDEIERAADCTIAEFFERYGEAEFRAGERRVIARLLDKAPLVLSTGGGAYMDPETRSLMKARALTVWLRAELDVLATHWPKDLPAGVIHADLFPDNVFFLGDDLSGLIDFYFACNDYLVYDLSICLNAWCFEKDGAYNITKGKAMIEGYLSVRPLSADEIASLPVLCRGSALRFFLTRLYDWLTTPEGALVVKKDPLEYLKKLRFHRAVTNASEYGLIS